MSLSVHRRWLLGAVAFGALFLGHAKNRRARADMAPIAQPPAATPAAFIDRAFEMMHLAEESGDQPYGAIVVRDGRIVGAAPSRVVVNGDPTAHAEMEAIRDAARRLGSRNLSGCILYSSSPPCPMCEAAAYWARIDSLTYTAAIVDGGRPRLSSC
jgi:tRNA(Arg) A34 adenosine deaminase TadA